MCLITRLQSAIGKKISSLLFSDEAFKREIVYVGRGEFVGDIDGVRISFDERLDDDEADEHRLLQTEEDEDEDDDDDNESTSSESSSTKSSHTTTHSSPSNIAKSSKAAVRAASMLIRGGKRQLSRLMTRSFLRRNGRKLPNGHQQPVDVDEEEDDGEKLLLNDGFNGDLKYKSSRNLKEQLQFDKTQLLQTIVNAHRGPIWCMK